MRYITNWTIREMAEKSKFSVCTHAEKKAKTQRAADNKCELDDTTANSNPTR